MPYDELIRWAKYFEKYPYGWEEDDRAFKIANVVAMSFGGKSLKPRDLFPSLEKLHKRSQVSQLFGRAKGGVQIPLE